MIELRGISFWYDDVPILESVDLTVDDGEFILVSGPTGSGKSTLLGVLTGLVPRFTGGTLTGDVRLDGASLLRTPPRERVDAIGYVGQDPLAGFVTDTVEEELAYGMEQLGLPAATMRRRVEETLDLLGIADLRHRDLRTLSGGQQQRVAIGSVLTMHPRVLVLDEPTSALDPTAAEDVLATLTRLVHDLGLTVLLAEHRLERVVPFADGMWLLAGDGTVEEGPPAELLAHSPVVPPIVELGLLAGWTPLPLSVREARRAARTLALPEGGLDTPPRSSGALDHRTESAAPKIRWSSAGRGEPGPDHGEFRWSSAGRGELANPAGVSRPPHGDPLLTARGVSVLRGKVAALREVDLDLTAGEVTALMGRNGAGKSTLLWTLQGSVKRAAGRVRVRTEAGERDPVELPAAARRASVALVPQTAADLLYQESVTQECAAADTGAGAPDGTCRALLERMVPGIDSAMHPRDLSEGQRLALVLAIVLTGSPPVVLLDEPTRGLDYQAKQVLADTLADLASAGHAVLVATHDVEFVAQAADRVLVLADGEVVSAGPVRDVVAESPAYAPQVTKILGPPWLTVAEVRTALRGRP